MNELKRANDLLDHSTDYMNIMKKLSEPKEAMKLDVPVVVNVPDTASVS